MFRGAMALCMMSSSSWVENDAARGCFFFSARIADTRSVRDDCAVVSSGRTFWCWTITRAATYTQNTIIGWFCQLR